MFFKTLIVYLLTKLKKYKFARILLYKISNKYKDYKVFDNFNLKSSSVFIDIGANIGNVSLYIKDIYNCEILAFEPHPQAYKVLLNRFKKIKNIKLKNLAVSDQDSLRSFFLHKNDIYNAGTLSYSGSGSLESKKNNLSKDNFITVETIELSKILNQYKYIDCIKIDIEGHEYSLFPILLKNIDKIGKVVCEMHGNSISHEYFKNRYDYYLNYFKEEKLLNKWIYLWI